MTAERPGADMAQSIESVAPAGPDIDARMARDVRLAQLVFDQMKTTGEDVLRVMGE